MGYFQVMMKGRNSVHGSRHLRPSWGDFTQPFRVSWLCWWCIAQGGRLLSNPQPPTSPANMDPDGLYQTWWWGSAHSITRRHVRNLRLHPARQCSIPPPAPWCGQPDLLTARAANLITSQELTVPVGCSYRTHITVCLYNGYITGANVKALCSGIFSNSLLIDPNAGACNFIM